MDFFRNISVVLVWWQESSAIPKSLKLVVTAFLIGALTVLTISVAIAWTIPSFLEASLQLTQLAEALRAKSIGILLLSGILVAILIAWIVLYRVFKQRALHHHYVDFTQRMNEDDVQIDNTSPEVNVDDTDILLNDSRVINAVRIKTADLLKETRIIAVVSGKGGVGKSTIALGLWELMSRTREVLLVDFDLHNRGLTSLLRKHYTKSAAAKAPSYVFGLLKKFLSPETIQLVREYRGAGQNVGPGLIDRIFELYEKFSELTIAEENNELSTVSAKDWPKRNVQGLYTPLRRSNAFFLPSLPAGGSVLDSKKVRDANEDAAFYFFQALSFRVARQKVIKTVIIDCHGAHDLYTVGLIRAATDLVVVTTPDVSSLEGTRELVRFADRVTRIGTPELPRSVLVANRCLPNDLNAGEIKKRWGGLLTGGVIQIEDSEVVEQTSRRYSFGDVVADRRYRAKLVDICNALELHSGEPDGADPTSPRAERRPGNEMT